MTLSEKLENLFSELNAYPFIYLSPARLGKSGNVKADMDWLDDNRLIFRSNLKGVLDSSEVDVFVKNTKALLNIHIGHFNWIEDIGENPEGTAKVLTRQGVYLDQVWTQIGLAVIVGENCRKD